MERLEENKFLITQSPVLNLLHAHGDSPKELCSSRLVPFANRTRFTPSVRKFANHLITLKNVCCGFHPNRNNILNKAIMESLRSQLSDKNSTSYRLNVLTSFQCSNVCNSQQTLLTPLTILTPLTFAPCDRAKTCMNTEFCGGGGI